MYEYCITYERLLNAYLITQVNIFNSLNVFQITRDVFLIYLETHETFLCELKPRFEKRKTNFISENEVFPGGLELILSPIFDGDISERKLH